MEFQVTRSRVIIHVQLLKLGETRESVRNLDRIDQLIVEKSKLFEVFQAPNLVNYNNAVIVKIQLF